MKTKVAVNKYLATILWIAVINTLILLAVVFEW